LVAATVEKASTYVFAERLIHSAEVRGSIPVTPATELGTYGRAHTLPFFVSHVLPDVVRRIWAFQACRFRSCSPLSISGSS